MLLVFALLYLTGGGDSVFYLLFFPLVAVNAYYFGPRAGLVMALLAGLLYPAAAALAPPWVGWTAVIIVSGLVGLPPLALGHLAARERPALAAGHRLHPPLLRPPTPLPA